MKFRKETLTAQTAVKKAGKVIMDFYESKSLKISKKVGEESFVTEADLAAEKAIIDILSKKFPDYSIYSEEAGEKKKESNCRWIIDPLDGTRNFSCGNPTFCTMVALQFKNDIISSAVYVPYTRDLYFAEKGKGAFLNGKKIHVSGRNDLERFLVLFEGLSFFDNATASKIIQNPVNNFKKNLRIIGSAGISGCFLAAGRCDAAIMYRMALQDTAPSYLLIKEAGGVVTDERGNPWTLNSTNFVASNDKVHQRLLNSL